MPLYTTKTRDSKDPSAANNIAIRQQANSSRQFSTDNRPESIFQRKLKAIANNSAWTKHLNSLMETTNDGPQKKNMALALPGVVQRKVYQYIGGKWVEHSKIEEEDVVTPENFPGDVKEGSLYDATAGKMVIDEKEENQRQLLYEVSLSSDIHHLDKLAERYLGVMTQPWGFSFAKTGIQETDVEYIKNYIKRWNKNEIEKPSHIVDGRKIRYTGETGIVYSTHDDSNQLYPISGPGVYRGKGAGDMYRILKKLNLDIPLRVIRLHEAYLHFQDPEVARKLQEKLEGGHRSGIEVPKPTYTNKAKIEKAKGLKKTRLDEQVETIRKELGSIPPSKQFSAGE